MFLNEIKAINNPHLSQSQKTVMCRVKVAASPIVAFDQTQETDNLVYAREHLVRMGMLKYDKEGGLEITAEGESTMTREGLIDDMGELTNDGQSLVSSEDQGTIPTTP